jgi:hypothetical protein
VGYALQGYIPDRLYYGWREGVNALNKALKEAGVEIPDQPDRPVAPRSERSKKGSTLPIPERK